MNFQEINAAALGMGLPQVWFPQAKRFGQSLRAGNLNGEPGILPDTAKEITIAADHNDTGLKAAHEAAQLWRDKGIKARVSKPPQHGTDFNDLLSGEIQ
jgi:Toprim domain